MRMLTKSGDLISRLRALMRIKFQSLLVQANDTFLPP
jgi:hypothetical protein